MQGTQKKIVETNRGDIKVVKGHALVNTGYSISTRATILISYLIAQIDSMHQEKIEPFELSYTDICRILNHSKRRIGKREEVVEIMKELNSKPIYWQEVKGEEIIADNWLTWIEKMRYDRKKDTFSFKIPQDLHDFLLKLGYNEETKTTKPYIAYRYVITDSFTCDYSTKIYEEIIKRARNEPYIQFELTIESLRFKCDLKKKYSRYYDLKRYVIQSSVEDINQNPYTAYSVIWKVGKKEGKAVRSLIITANRKKSILPLPEKIIENQKQQPINTSKKTTAKESTARVEELYEQIHPIISSWNVFLPEELEAQLKKLINSLLKSGKTIFNIKEGVTYTQNKIEAGHNIADRLAYLYKMINEASIQGDLFDPIANKKKVADKRKEDRHKKREEAKSELEEYKRKYRDFLSAEAQVMNEIGKKHPEKAEEIFDEIEASPRWKKKLSEKENLERGEIIDMIHRKYRKVFKKELQDFITKFEELEEVKEKVERKLRK